MLLREPAEFLYLMYLIKIKFQTQERVFSDDGGTARPSALLPRADNGSAQRGFLRTSEADIVYTAAYAIFLGGRISG
jgi:hypothetical protein